MATIAYALARIGRENERSTAIGSRISSVQESKCANRRVFKVIEFGIVMFILKWIVKRTRP